MSHGNSNSIRRGKPLAVGGNCLAREMRHAKGYADMDMNGDAKIEKHLSEKFGLVFKDGKVFYRKPD